MGSEEMFIESDYMKLKLSDKGFITGVTDKTHGKTIPVDLKVTLS